MWIPVNQNFTFLKITKRLLNRFKKYIEIIQCVARLNKKIKCQVENLFLFLWNRIKMRVRGTSKLEYFDSYRRFLLRFSPFNTYKIFENTSYTYTKILYIQFFFSKQVVFSNGCKLMYEIILLIIYVILIF